MARSSWKLKYFSTSVWRKVIRFYKKKIFKYKRSLFFDRSSHIPECFKNFSFRVYKGNGFRKLLINKYNIGLKFGEFSFTRKPFHFPLRKKKGTNYIRR